jgi:hypothetical protein
MRLDFEGDFDGRSHQPGKMGDHLGGDPACIAPYTSRIEINATVKPPLPIQGNPMPIPSVPAETLLAALTRFDHEFRDTPDWADREGNKAHLYAVNHTVPRDADASTFIYETRHQWRGGPVTTRSCQPNWRKFSDSERHLLDVACTRPPTIFPCRRISPGPSSFSRLKRR